MSTLPPKSVTGRHRTWTGRIVSREEWERLSNWDRYGPPPGYVFCAIARRWIHPSERKP
ncbi:hypothetical protein [Rhodovulum sp. BSW8]|uniref:hypothetical protein n=1 Tax=Rhodovulum sp. BSW8 TaxID=2259645 RepID=UPI0014039D3C|nr:hypothetical protein [Rhodovulum sp. BSW8]